MSFLGAIFSGLGGYMQGRQQNQLFELQKQQQQQDLQMRQAQLGMEQAKWKESARQILAGRGIDPNTAQYNPATGEFTGGTPFAMPKGYEVVPTDPAKAMQHWANLMQIYTQQGRPDEADIASKMYEAAGAQQKTAATQMFELQKLGLTEQEQMRLAQYREQNAWGRANLAHEDALQMEQMRLDSERSIRNSPTAYQIYQVSTKNPDAMLKATGAQFNSNTATLSRDLDTLTKQNQTSQTAQLKAQGGVGDISSFAVPNPNMDQFSDRIHSAVQQVVDHPEYFQNTLNSIKAAGTRFNTPLTDPKKVQALAAKGYKVALGSPDPTGLSPDQVKVATDMLYRTVGPARAAKSAQHAINIYTNQFKSGQMGGYDYSGGGGGSYAGQNPTSGPRVHQHDIWNMLRDNGATPQEATTLTAVAMAESGGNPGAVNPTDNNGKQSSWGLFQISDGTHRELPGWNDPVMNTRMAIAKLRSQGLKAWGTYNSGAYQQYLPQRQ